ncbi:MAG: TIGR02452 family protein [Oscillospiraceae bacterium]|nr:TIGR02452 family protein [Oscillospiraceae bacterium]
MVICKTDESVPRRLPEEQFVTVDVLTCAAPNLRRTPGNRHNPDASRAASVTRKQLFDLHVKRAKHVLHVAAANRVDCLVLGAFGCGAFENDPNVVARAYAAALEEYRHYFDTIEFAIYCREWETENYNAFKAWCK